MLPISPNARSVSSPTASSRQRPAGVSRVRGAIRAVTADLRALDALVGGIAQELPRAGESFDVLAEVGEGLRCVRTDLLADAIETLDALATLEDTELRRRFERRQGWLEAEGA